MDTLPKIRTPWKHQFRRIRYQLVPVISMGLATLATVFLWNRHVGTVDGVGEVIADKRNVYSSADGTLMDLPDPLKPLKLLRPVHKGDIIARIFTPPDERALADLQRRTAEALAQLPKASAASTRPADPAMMRDFVEKRLKLIELRAAHRGEPTVGTEFNRREYALYKARDELDNLREQVSRAVPENLTFQKFENRVPELQFGKIRELEAKMTELDFPEIRATMDGELIDIQRYPGQPVVRGGLIATIGALKANTVLSYLRQEQGVQARIGEFVEIRTRRPGQPTLQGVIERMGTRAESVPVHQLRDQKVREFGTPVFISVDNLELNPGYLVDVRFKSRAGAN